jgi:hypothetical protein
VETQPHRSYLPNTRDRVPFEPGDGHAFPKADRVKVAPLSVKTLQGFLTSSGVLPNALHCFSPGGLGIVDQSLPNEVTGVADGPPFLIKNTFISSDPRKPESEASEQSPKVPSSGKSMRDRVGK